MKGTSLRQVFNFIFPSFALDKLNSVAINYHHINKTQEMVFERNYRHREKFNVLVDGTMLIYHSLSLLRLSGKMKETDNNEILAITCLNIITNIIKSWTLEVSIKNVTILFDDVKYKPKIKTKKQNPKILMYKNTFRLKKVINLIDQYSIYLNKFVKFKVKTKFSSYGEGDFGYFERDINSSTIIVSNDGDVFLTIANHTPKTLRDKVLIYALDKKLFYLPTIKLKSLSRDAIQCLLILLGTDYSPKIFNNKAVDFMKNFEFNGSIDTKEEFKTFLVKFYNFMLKLKRFDSCSVKYIFSEQYKLLEDKESYENLLNLLFSTYKQFNKGKILNKKDYTKDSRSKEFFEYLKGKIE